ncbi:helix-turn-helix domain-containing protein [Nocardia otitidiscaviarum]|uniref:helix-turn-helix domain-containing protein n=1 Tax=Nocardia otitidiscaviarum TaxID=1823 RepID=UPI002458F46E|nr:helix-turn-helix domain-containing protein [Nocardia otitidiscaviarum]
MVNNMFGEYLRQRRLDAGLSRAQLAARANVSVSLIEKIEAGTRTTTLNTLQVLFDELTVPPIYRRHILGLVLPSVFGRVPHPESAGPAPSDLADLASLDHPASFYLMPTFTIVAANTAYQRTFPGMRAGGNFVEWMFLDPNARTVMVEWHREAHRLQHGLRMFTSVITPDRSVEEIIERCRVAPEWEELWNSGLPEPDSPEESLHIRDVRSRRVSRMAVRLYTPELPARPWWLFRLIPEEFSRCR